MPRVEKLSCGSCQDTLPSLLFWYGPASVRASPFLWNGALPQSSEQMKGEDKRKRAPKTFPSSFSSREATGQLCPVQRHPCVYTA